MKVISTEPIYINPYEKAGCYMIVISIMLAIVVLSEIKNMNKFYLISGIISIVGIIAGLSLANVSVKTNRNEYHVVFNKDYDNTILNILEKYELVDKNGDIYILRDKEVIDSS